MLNLFVERTNNSDDPAITYVARIKNESDKLLQLPVNNRGEKTGFILTDADNQPLVDVEDMRSLRGMAEPQLSEYVTLQPGEIFDADYWSFNDRMSNAIGGPLFWRLSAYRGKTVQVSYVFEPETHAQVNSEAPVSGIDVIREVLKSEPVSVSIPVWTAENIRSHLELVGPLGLPELFSHLKKLVKDDVSKVRENTAYSLGEIEHVETARLIEKLLKDKDRDVQVAALTAAEKRKDPSLVSPLLMLLDHDDAWIARRTIEVLAHLPDERTVDRVLQLARSGSPNWESMLVGSDISLIAKTLGQVKSEPALAKLISALADTSRTIRSLAAEALSYSSDPEAAGALTAHLNEKDAWVRSTIERSLKKIQSADALMKAMAGSDVAIRINALQTINDLENPAFIPVIINALRDKNVELRRKAAEGLGKYKSPESRKALVFALGDADAKVRYYSIISLRQIGDVEALPAIEDRLGTETSDDNVYQLNWTYRELAKKK